MTDVVIDRRSFFVSAAALAACRGRAGSGFRGLAVIACADSHAISIVDLLAFAVRRTIDLGAAPAAVLRHPDPRRRVTYAPLPEASAVAEIDLGAGGHVRRAVLPVRPLEVRAERPSGLLWVLAQGAASLVPVDPGPLRGLKPIPLAAAPVSFDLSPTARQAAVTLTTKTVQFVDLAQRKAGRPVPLEGALGAVRYRSDGKVVVVAGRERSTLIVLDPVSTKPIVELPLALRPDFFCTSADGGQLFITGEGRDAVVIVYIYRTEIAQTSLSGRRPAEMAASAFPPYLFVSNPQAGSVSVFDIQTQRVVAVTGVGVEPGRIAITPDQQYALVLNRASGDMAVIRIAAITPGRAKSAPLFTMIPVGASPLDLVILPL